MTGDQLVLLLELRRGGFRRRPDASVVGDLTMLLHLGLIVDRRNRCSSCTSRKWKHPQRAAPVGECHQCRWTGPEFGLTEPGQKAVDRALAGANAKPDGGEDTW